MGCFTLLASSCLTYAWKTIGFPEENDLQTLSCPYVHLLLPAEPQLDPAKKETSLIIGALEP